MPQVRFFFAWYDLWVGVFIDRKQRRVYVCPLPMVVILLEWGNATESR